MSSSTRERNRRVCRRCRFSTSDEQKFLQHQLTHHPEESLSDTRIHSLRRSTDSERSISYDEGLREPSSSKQRHHPFGVDDRTEEDLVLRSGLTLPTRTYTCSDCGASTTNPRQHLHHLVQDHGYDYTIYECDLCDYATRYKQKLPRHRRCHFVSPSESRVLSPPQLTRRTRSHSEMEVDKLTYSDQKDDLDSRSDDSGVKDINENVKDGNDISDDRLRVRGNGKAVRDEEMEEDDDDDHSLVIDTRVTPSDAGPFIVEKPLANSPIHHHMSVPTVSMPHPLPPVMPPKTTKKGTAPIREAVDPAKYIRVQDVDGIKYACSKCGNIYKWRKSLNKHWKEKHDGEIPTPLGPGGYAALNIPHLVGQGLGLPFSLKSHTQSRIGMKGFPDLGRHGLYSNAMNFDKMNFDKMNFDKMNFEKAAASMKPFLPTSPSKDAKWGMEGFRRSPVVSTPSPKPTSIQSSVDKSFSLPSPGYRPHIPKDLYSSSSSSNTEAKKQLNAEKGLLTTSPYLLNVPPAAHSKGIKSTPEPCDEAPLDLSKPSSKGDTIIIEENNGEVLNLSRGESLPTAAKLKTSNNFSTDFSKKIESVMNCYLSGGAVQVKQEMPDVYAAGNFGVWQCFKCPYSAKDASDYEQHLASHAGNKNSNAHRCAECLQSFSSLEDLNEHFGNSHSDLVKSYKAGDSSDLLSKSRENLQLYRYLTMPKDGTYKCMVCGSVFSWQWDLARHFDKYHMSLPNPYQHPDSLEDEESLDGERSPKRARLEQDLTCQLCTFQARDREELRRHLLVHSLNKQYACTMCGYSTQWQEDLNQHIRRYHKKDSDSLSLTDEENLAAIYEKKSYLSSLGLRSNDDPDSDTPRSNIDLSSHKSVSPSPSKHHGGSYTKKTGRSSTNSAEILLPYKCSVCEYRARWPSEITQHMKNHSDEKPFRCPRCTYKSKWKWDVVKHLKRCGGGTVKDVIDTSKGKSSTPTWVKALQFKSNMSSGPPNVTVVSPPTERPNDGEALMPYYRGGEDSQGSTSSRSPAQLHCLQCPFVSSSPAELKRHSRVHSDDKPFACITCGYSSKWKCDLKKHLRTYLHVAAPMEVSDRSNDEDEDDDADISGAGSFDSEDSEDQAAHKCNKCSFSTASRSAFENHLKMHGQEKSNKLRCKQCDYEAADLPAFLQHKLVHSQESREMSVEREDTTTPTTDTPRHRRKPQKQFCCDKCPYATFDRANMETHQECHEANNLDFTCDYCDFSTNDQDVMDEHIRLHPEFFNDMQPQNDNGADSETDVEDNNQIENDDKIEKAKEENTMDDKPDSEEPAKKADEEKEENQNEENHFLVESSHPNSRRQGEGESFQEKDSFGKCDSDEHSENEQMTDSSESLSCPKCPFTSCSQSAMQRHLDAHGSDGKFMCDACDFATNRMNSLLQHKKCHVSNMLLKGSNIPVTDLSKDNGNPLNRNTSLSCQLCPFVTSNVKALQIHIQMHIMGRNSSSNSPVPYPISRPRSPEHTQEKSKFYYKCNRCPYQTNNRGNFESHKTQHHIRSKLQCPYCDYSSARSAQISSHVRLHFPGNQLESDVLWTLVLAANQTTEVGNSPSTSEDPEADDSAHSTESDPCVSANSVKKSCRYCDRQFPDMLAREMHEKQHLVDVSVC